MQPIELTWYKGLVLLVSVIALVVGVVNIVYFNRIRLSFDSQNTNKCNEISQSEATTALWFNIIMVILSSITLFWSFIRLVHWETPEDKIVHKTTNVIKHPTETTEVPHGPEYIYQAEQM